MNVSHFVTICRRQISPRYTKYGKACFSLLMMSNQFIMSCQPMSQQRRRPVILRSCQIISAHTHIYVLMCVCVLIRWLPIQNTVNLNVTIDHEIAASTSLHTHWTTLNRQHDQLQSGLYINIKSLVFICILALEHFLSAFISFLPYNLFVLAGFFIYYCPSSRSFFGRNHHRDHHRGNRYAYVGCLWPYFFFFAYIRQPIIQVSIS